MSWSLRHYVVSKRRNSITKWQRRVPEERNFRRKLLDIYRVQVIDPKWSLVYVRLQMCFASCPIDLSWILL